MYQLETSRLLLSTFNLSDGRDLYQHITPTLTRYLTWDPPVDFETQLAFYQNRLKLQTNGTEQHFILRTKDTRIFIGIISLHDLHSSTPEFGLWIREDKHQQGFAKEAIKAVYDWAIQRAEIEYFIYPVATENLVSQKIAESLAGQRVGLVHRKKFDSYIYHIPVINK